MYFRSFYTKRREVFIQGNNKFIQEKVCSTSNFILIAVTAAIYIVNEQHRWGQGRLGSGKADEVAIPFAEEMVTAVATSTTTARYLKLYDWGTHPLTHFILNSSLLHTCIMASSGHKDATPTCSLLLGLTVTVVAVGDSLGFSLVS